MPATPRERMDRFFEAVTHLFDPLRAFRGRHRTQQAVAAALFAVGLTLA